MVDQGTIYQSLPQLQPLLNTSSVRSFLLSKKESANKRLKSLVGQTQKVLLKITAVFPFDFFPDSITVDENKINIISRDFFFSEDVHSVLLEDITDLHVNTNPFFATLEIVDSSNYRFPIIFKVNFLRISEALHARKLIQGLIVARNQKLDLGHVHLKTHDLENNLEKIGEAKFVE